MRQAAAEFDDFKSTLDITFGIVDDLAMLSAQHLCQLTDMLFNQRLEIKHNPRPPLRIGHRPRRLGCLSSSNRLLQHGRITQSYASLNAAIIWVHDVAITGGNRRFAYDDVIDLTHDAVSF